MTASADQTVRVWDAIVQYEEAPTKPEERVAKRILQGHSGIVNCLLWSGMICSLSLVFFPPPPRSHPRYPSLISTC